MWDETLFAGAAPFYERGRPPYPPGLSASITARLGLDGRGVLVDVGAGPGTLTVLLAAAFARVVAVEPDPDMVAHGRRATAGLPGVEWRTATAERLGLAPASVDMVTFAQSFHWTDRARVAAAVHAALRPGGRLVLISPVTGLPLPWRIAVDGLVAEFLGPIRRAGQRLLHAGTPGNEEEVLAAAGFTDLQRWLVPDGRVVERDTEALAAHVYSLSSSAPHLFGDRFAEFHARLRALLADVAPVRVVLPEVEVRAWTR